MRASSRMSAISAASANVPSTDGQGLMASLCSIATYSIANLQDLINE